MVRVEASLLQKRAHGRTRPPGRSFLGHASEGWPQAGAGRGKRGRENQRHRDLAGGIAQSHGPPSFPATCAPRPTTGLTGFLRFNLEEPWTAAQQRVERRRGEPGARLAPDSGGGCSERPGIPPPGQGARAGSLGPPQKGPGPAGAWSPLPAPARGLPPEGTGRGPQTPLAEAAAGGARVGRPPAPPHTRLEMTRQQRSPSKDGPIRPPSRGDNASSAPPLCVETVSYARPHSQAHHQNLSSCICVR